MDNNLKAEYGKQFNLLVYIN